MIKNILSCLFLFILLIINFSCNTTEPPPPEKDYGTITLSVLESSCTEAWVNIKANGVTLPVKLNILKDNSIEETFILNSSDTTIYIDSLSANTNYNIKAEFTVDGQTVESSQLAAKTFNTTSNNFTWQKFSIGDNSGVLRDVAIIDENNIWAVGEIYMRDSTGQPDPQPYNLVRWVGNNWKLYKLSFPQFNYDCSIAFYAVGAIPAVLAFNDNNILFTDGLSVAHWDGNKYTFYPCVSLSIIGNGWFTKIWGISENNFYCVGTNGTIFHYQMDHWTKIESGISLGFVSIWGDVNPFNNKTEIMAGAYNQFPSEESDLAMINDDNTSEQADKTGLGNSYGRIWFRAGIKYYLVGGGLYTKGYNSNTWKDLNQGKATTSYYMDCVKGTGLNDVYVAGAYGEMLHYNGSTWKSFMNQTSLSFGQYYALAVKGNLVVAVGYDQGKGVILMGRNL